MVTMEYQVNNQWRTVYLFGGIAALIALLPGVTDIGIHFIPGNFPGFFLAEPAGILTALAIIRGKLLPRATGIVAVIGYSFLFLFICKTTFFKGVFEVAMIFALVGGLAGMAAYVLIAIGLFRHAGKQVS